jgi:XTP/dITP diphosphohydrolase
VATGERLRDWHELRLDPAVPIIVATKNLDKFREIAELWGSFVPPVAVAGAEYPDVEEHGATYEENAVLKARALADLFRRPALADDSGIEVDALGKEPGVLSARTPYLGALSTVRNEHILRAVNGKDRVARFVSVCALAAPGFEPIVARGEVHGLVADEPRGEHGFGYDPIFFYPPYQATFGEVEAARKHAVSHRGRSVRALQARIASLVSP